MVLLIKRRVKLLINGRVQGVGFRPTVFRYAVENKLTGFVCNAADGVYIEAEGLSANIKRFIEKIKTLPPSRSRITTLSVIPAVSLKNERNFSIIETPSITGTIQTEISPDIAVCDDCLKELFNRQDRRHLFPFINCTNCGPRYTITENIPYDRKNTSMTIFKMCPLCSKEYNDAANRRFHAQPNCCFTCGPDIFLTKNRILSRGVNAVEKTADLIREGSIVAVKGSGGYHLVCDAKNTLAVNRLRTLKKRGDKPFALMAGDIKTIKQHCSVNKEEEQLLTSWRTPVVLLKKRANADIPDEVAPCNKYLGFFLPYTPVHHLLFFFGCPDVIVATSANIADSPIIFKDSKKELKKLAGISDYILTNNRPIKTGCDDSVLRLSPEKKPYIIRKARGYTPEAITTPVRFKKQVFAAGAEEKNTFAFGREEQIIMSQHTGSQENMESFNFYSDVFNRFTNIFRFSPEIIAYDLHPDYIPTKFAIELAKQKKLQTIGIQHHHSHIASCMMDNNLPNEKIIGIAFDGTGYGEDGDIRGAEFLITDYTQYERYAFLDNIPLPGGTKAIKDVWRIGAALLYTAFGDEFLRQNIPFTKKHRRNTEYIGEMLKKDINCLPASSMGRLFDGISAILGIRDTIAYEAEAAVCLEMTAQKTDTKKYLFNINKPGALFVIDPSPIIKEIVADIKKGTATEIISYRFNKTVSAMITEICKKIRKEKNISRVALSGGVFQNNLLLNMAWTDLRRNGFSVYCHHHIPANDAGISAGQAVIALYSQYRKQ
ncbi:MAG: carbamoyltransferase HypF [Elusimicrobia bacterium]|nr:carbamoyltransferase HypF [Elusimicrobiota bacterium]